MERCKYKSRPYCTSSSCKIVCIPISNIRRGLSKNESRTSYITRGNPKLAPSIWHKRNPLPKDPNSTCSWGRYAISRLSVKPEIKPHLEHGKTLFRENLISLGEFKLDPLLWYRKDPRGGNPVARRTLNRRLQRRASETDNTNCQYSFVSKHR